MELIKRSLRIRKRNERNEKRLKNKDIANPRSDSDNDDIVNDSLQYNAQELEQEQNSYLNPMQLNSQTVHVHVHNDNQYTSQITGTTYLAKNTKIAIANSTILLYFGSDSSEPVYETVTDKDGNFVIKNIPPGYYIISAFCGEYIMDKSSYLKILPGQDLNYSLFLK